MIMDVTIAKPQKQETVIERLQYIRKIKEAIEAHERGVQPVDVTEVPF